MKEITGLDRFVFYLDRILAVLAYIALLWVQSVKGDFVVLLLGIIFVLGWVLTTRYLYRHFRASESSPVVVVLDKKPEQP